MTEPASNVDDMSSPGSFSRYQTHWHCKCQVASFAIAHVIARNASAATQHCKNKVSTYVCIVLQQVILFACMLRHNMVLHHGLTGTCVTCHTAGHTAAHTPPLPLIISTHSIWLALTFQPAGCPRTDTSLQWAGWP